MKIFIFMVENFYGMYTFEELAARVELAKAWLTLTMKVSFVSFTTMPAPINTKKPLLFFTEVKRVVLLRQMIAQTPQVVSSPLADGSCNAGQANAMQVG